MSCESIMRCAPPLQGDFILSASASFASLALARLNATPYTLCGGVSGTSGETPLAEFPSASLVCEGEQEKSAAGRATTVLAVSTTRAAASSEETGMSTEDACTQATTTAVEPLSKSARVQSGSWVDRRPAAPASGLSAKAVAERLSFMRDLSNRMQQRVQYRGRREHVAGMSTGFPSVVSGGGSRVIPYLEKWTLPRAPPPSFSSVGECPRLPHLSLAKVTPHRA
ncbi:hypothetical protein NESM_000294300 [Novymonas esmeraldas]|uniref:Uncharacterized protein n=1 Tax=Novymonas esmeraldas TaxID=1808958 RepID=A0AAW0FAT0_9TRYP